MSRKTIWGIVIAGMLIVAMVGTALAVDFVTIVTGSTGGTYYPVGTIIANSMNKALMAKGVKASAQSSGGTVENLKMLKNGEAEMAIAMSNLTGFAYKGIKKYEGNAIPSLRYVMGLWPDVTQIVIRKEADINTWGDLKGKRMAVGPPASGTEFTSRLVLQAVAGLTFDDITPEYIGYSEAAQALQNGRLDAFNAETGYPVSAVSELYAGRTSVGMLEFSDDEVKALQTEAPYYARVVIPADVYPKQTKPLKLVGVKSALIVSDKVSEEIVYETLKVIYGDRKAMGQAHAAFSKVDYEHPLAGLYGAPLHPGAVRFFREKGFKIPEGLLPPGTK
ncbi:MAG: C4-dicarboxylate ABC transporter substrate-binding protein [Dethiosulfovibrio peptidovorans]|nr:MAG: C4-dicarboxylate ABC transporter substrate-binding protein [Dethiosulfovibrio peptidovorans]